MSALWFVLALLGLWSFEARRRALDVFTSHRLALEHHRRLKKRHIAIQQYMDEHRLQGEHDQPALQAAHDDLERTSQAVAVVGRVCRQTQTAYDAVSRGYRKTCLCLPRLES